MPPVEASPATGSRRGRRGARRLDELGLRRRATGSLGPLKWSMIHVNSVV